MTHPADAHATIEVRGARENNLRDVSLDLPKRRLTVFTGVSGSGKSSLVFGTIAAESQRLINETYSAFVQNFMGSPPRPEVDALRNLSTAIVVDQERMGASTRSTVGTATDAAPILRVLFSRLGEPHVGPSHHFSFNNAEGACPACEGMGRVSDIDLDAVLDRSKSLNDGAITVPGYTPDGWYVQTYSASGRFDPDQPVGEFTDAQLADLPHADPEKIQVNNINVTYEGLLPKLRKSILAKDPEDLQPHLRRFVERAVVFQTCGACDGSRLNEAARTSLVAGVSIADVCSWQVDRVARWVAALDAPEIGPLQAHLGELLRSMIDIGLGYLGLDRQAGSLSGGEAQRVKMVRHLGSSLTDLTYVFDEPSVGLHPHDIARMNALLLQLRDKGNTVLVVEHKPEVIAIADHVVDLGPGAGPHGGEVCFSGDLDGLRRSGTLTGKHLDHRVSLKDDVRTPSGTVRIEHADRHNLRDVDVDVPLGVLTVVTGVAGSGKSSLMHGYLGPREGVIAVDQTPIRGSRRSNPATYTGLLDHVRSAFAKANGVKPALFSANSAGACPTCKGLGVVYTDLAMMAGVASPCEECEGRRFTAEVLAHTLDGKNIAEVLAMPITEAHAFFTTGKAHQILTRLVDVGLGYLSLGQPLSTLSGGERQRMKLAITMASGPLTYLLDEPTTGLHLADVEAMLALLDRLVDAGNSVVVIEHHQAVMAHADWIIDLGPGAGSDGGTVVFEGTPADLVADASTLTGRHLREYVDA